MGHTVKSALLNYILQLDKSQQKLVNQKILEASALYISQIMPNYESFSIYNYGAFERTLNLIYKHEPNISSTVLGIEKQFSVITLEDIPVVHIINNKVSISDYRIFLPLFGGFQSEVQDDSKWVLLIVISYDRTISSVPSDSVLTRCKEVQKLLNTLLPIYLKYV